MNSIDLLVARPLSVAEFEATGVLLISVDGYNANLERASSA